MSSDSRAVGFQPLGHVPALDGLRGVAVLVVVVFHLGGLFPDGPTLLSGGFLGVDVFFVLSGFLITSILLGERAASGRTRYLRFFGRRALRLYPAILAFMLGYFAYAATTGLDLGALSSNLLAIGFYYFNWQITWDFFGVVEGVGHLWSLSVEEQFYLAWPFVVAGLTLVLAGRIRLQVAVIALAIVAVVVMRNRLVDDGVSPLLIYVRTDARADGLLVGALAAYLWGHRLLPQPTNVRRWGGVCTAGIAVAFVAADVDQDWLYRGGFTAFAFAVAVVIWLIVAVPTSATSRVMQHRALQLLGRVSYGTYIWHLPVFLAVKRYGSDWPGVVRVAVALLVTAAIVAASWKLIETPALRLKHRRLGADASIETSATT